jgi:hypothetical protein
MGASVVTREEQSQRNRADFPYAAEMLAHYRSIFGEGCKLKWASENGKEIGTKSQSVPISVGPETEEASSSKSGATASRKGNGRQ